MTHSPEVGQPILDEHLPLQQGAVIWASVADPHGNKKNRPVLVISANEDMASDDEPDRPLIGVAITTTFHKPLGSDHVALPWAANGSARTGLRRESVAVCSWIVKLKPGDVIEVKGLVSGRILDDVLSRLPSGDDSGP